MINILIADDNDSNIYVLEMLIEEWFDENNIQNYNIDSVLNGAETIQKMEEKNYDILFLDIMMPIMDGFEALKHIRAKNLSPETKIIVASAVIDDDENKNKARTLKANAFIVKPLSYDTINIMMTRYLQDKDISENEETKNSTKYIYFDHGEKKEVTVLNSATFLNEYPENIIDEEDIEELQHFILTFIHNANSLTELEEQIYEFKQIIEKTRLMILSFSEFQNLNITLNEIHSFAEELNNINISNEDSISKLLLQITEHISNWIEDVFIDKTSENVLSINSTILQDFLILKEIVLQD